MSVQVHISGLTRPEDAHAAAQAGADAFSLYFWRQSTSSVTVRQAQAILSSLPPDAFTLGIFVDSVASVVERTLDQTGIRYALFAGQEDAAYCRRFAGRYVKVVRVRDLASLDKMSQYECPFYVLDGDPAVHSGVREIPFDVNLARRAKRLGKVVVSGGLNLDNIQPMIRAARPYGVEVSSGVESVQGIKDPSKLQRFVELAKTA